MPGASDSPCLLTEIGLHLQIAGWKNSRDAPPPLISCDR